MLSLILLLTVNVLALLIYLQTAGWGHPGQHRFEGGSSQGSLLSAVLSGHALEAPGHQLRSLIATMTRAGIPATLQAEGLKVGAELGVQVSCPCSASLLINFCARDVLFASLGPHRHCLHLCNAEWRVCRRDAPSVEVL